MENFDKRIQRIKEMENILDSATAVFEKLDSALEEYRQLLPELGKLVEYYENDWQDDYIADEEGKFPQDMKRGVLGQDSIYNLLTEWQRLKEEMKADSED